jgi:hypothetical protein
MKRLVPLLAVVAAAFCGAGVVASAHSRVASNQFGANIAASSVVLAPGQPIEIAVPVDQTTPGLAPYGTAARNAVQMAIESDPQIKGFVVQQDDVASGACSDPTANAGAATSIVANPHVMGVVGHMCSAGLAGALPIYESAGVVTLSGSATDPSLTGLGPSVFDRTIVNDADGESTWLPAVEQMPSVLAWQQRYQARFGIPPTSFAELYYDAANLLLNRINQVATLDASGNLVIDRGTLAAAVRNTTNFQGVSGCISLDAGGNRLNTLGDCAPVIASISPTSGSIKGRTTVTIVGQYLLATSVSFGSRPAAHFTVNSPTQITAVSPPGSAPGAVTVSVTTGSGQSAAVPADEFTYTACVVPKLKGKTLKNARNALKRADCQLGKVNPKNQTTGHVKTQSPRAGGVLAPGSRVQVKLG